MVPSSINGAMTMTDNEISDVSIREKNLWIELLVNCVIAIYYIPKLFWLIHFGDSALRGAAMVNLIIGTVMVAIFANAALAALLHVKQKPEPMDERDLLIDQRASNVFGKVLQSCMLLVIASIAIQEMHDRAWMHLPMMISPLVIANVLLVGFMLAGILRDVMKVSLYRRGA